jgi:hypothetical protein
VQCLSLVVRESWKGKRVRLHGSVASRWERGEKADVMFPLSDLDQVPLSLPRLPSMFHYSVSGPLHGSITRLA